MANKRKIFSGEELIKFFSSITHINASNIISLNIIGIGIILLILHIKMCK